MTEVDLKKLVTDAWEASDLDKYYETMSKLLELGFQFEGSYGDMKYFQSEALHEYISDVQKVESVVELDLSKLKEDLKVIFSRAKALEKEYDERYK